MDSVWKDVEAPPDDNEYHILKDERGNCVVATYNEEEELWITPEFEVVLGVKWTRIPEDD